MHQLQRAQGTLLAGAHLLAERASTVCEEERREKARRLQKVIELCDRFVANLAYFRTGWSDDGRRRFATEPYVTFNRNSFDQVYLYWNKLFGRWDEQHHWRRIVSEPDRFKEGLLAALGCDEKLYLEFWKKMQKVRNEVVAHQDVYEEIPTPILDKGLTSVSYLWNHIYEEAQAQEIHIGYRYDPIKTYEKYQEIGAKYWSRVEPTPENR